MCGKQSTIYLWVLLCACLCVCVYCLMTNFSVALWKKNEPCNRQKHTNIKNQAPVWDAQTYLKYNCIGHNLETTISIHAVCASAFSRYFIKNNVEKRQILRALHRGTTHRVVHPFAVFFVISAFVCLILLFCFVCENFLIPYGLLRLLVYRLFDPCARFVGKLLVCVCFVLFPLGFGFA